MRLNVFPIKNLIPKKINVSAPNNSHTSTENTALTVMGNSTLMRPPNLVNIVPTEHSGIHKPRLVNDP